MDEQELGATQRAARDIRVANTPEEPVMTTSASLSPATLELEWSDYKAFLESSFDRYAGRASELVRQLALGGIAVVWVLRNTLPSPPVLPTTLKIAAALLMLTLTMDVLHYVVGMQMANSRLTSIEKAERASLEQGQRWPAGIGELPPRFPHGRMEVLYWTKLVLLAASYALVLVYMFLTF